MIELFYWPTPNGHNVMMFQQQDLDDFANVRRWFESIRSRPSTVRVYAEGEPFSAQPAVTEEGKKLLFGQTAASVAKN